jgi:methenyltetrahydrofolate cyclohydrolase
MLVDKSVAQILDAFASSDPTPGGGSAAALAGAVGAALLLMVARMPKTRTAAETDRPPLDAAVAALQPIAGELRALIDRDTAAYDAVVAAYRLPKGTEQEKAARKDAIQAGMRGAIDAPLAVMRASRTALRHAAAVETHGNPNAASDVTVATALLRAAVEGARANVEINLGSVPDEGYVGQVRREIGEE